MSGMKWGFVVNGIAWYLSAMFIGMVIIYPIVRKTRKDILIIYAPLAAIFMLTYLSKKYGNLNVVSDAQAYIHPGLIRAAAELLLGVCSYIISKHIYELKPGRICCNFLSLIEIASYSLVILLCCVKKDGQDDFILLMFLFIGITITFSGCSATSRKIIIAKSNVLGKISMLLFLNQRCYLYLVPELQLTGYAKNLAVFICFVLISSLVTYFAGNMLKQTFANIRSKVK